MISISRMRPRGNKAIGLPPPSCKLLASDFDMEASKADGEDTAAMGLSLIESIAECRTRLFRFGTLTDPVMLVVKFITEERQADSSADSRGIDTWQGA